MLGSRKDARKMHGVFGCRMGSDARDNDFIFVEYNSTVMDEGLILFLLYCSYVLVGRWSRDGPVLYRVFMLFYLGCRMVSDAREESLTKPLLKSYLGINKKY